MMISERSRTLKHDTTMTLTTALFKVRYDHNLITGRAKTLFDMTMFFSQDDFNNSMLTHMTMILTTDEDFTGIRTRTILDMTMFFSQDAMLKLKNSTTMFNYSMLTHDMTYNTHIS